METLYQIDVNNSVVEFLHSIFDNVPMRTMDEIEMCVRCHPVTKEAKKRFDDAHKALFVEFAVLMPKGNAGKGGGKVKKGEMAHQVPEERKEEYQERFLELANEMQTLVFEKKDMAILKDQWITPEWLTDRVERFHTANGIDSITHMKVLLQCREALQNATEYKEEKAGDENAA